MAVDRQGGDQLSKAIGKPGHCKEGTKQCRANDDNKYHGTGLPGFKKAAVKIRPAQSPPSQSEQEGAECSDPTGLGGTEYAEIDSPDDKQEQHQHDPHIL